MAPRPAWWRILQVSRREALLAVDLYNRSSSERSLEAFVVHMNLAWLYLCHAKLNKSGTDYRYREVGSRKFVRIDGDIKMWSLRDCLRELFPNTPSPVRANVEFFVAIRNKIEHRYEKMLATVLAGKSQALVYNYETTLTDWFGPEEALGDELRFPVFLSTLTPGAVEALKETHKRLPKKLVKFIEESDADLDSAIAADWRYDFRVFLIPQKGPKTEADVVMRFVREDDVTTPEAKGAVEIVQTIVRRRDVPVQNMGQHKPGAVAREVSRRLGYKFDTSTHHVRAWRHFEVRPSKGQGDMAATDSRYCIWDAPHQDHLYTDAWIEKLVRHLKDPSELEKVTGKKPIPL